MVQPIKFLKLAMSYTTSERIAMTRGPNPEPIRIPVLGFERWLTERDCLEENNSNLQNLIQETVVAYCKEWLKQSGSIFKANDHQGPIGFQVQVEDQNKNTFIKRFAFVGVFIPSRYVTNIERRQQEVEIQRQMLKDIRTLDKDVTLFTLVSKEYCATTIDWIGSYPDWDGTPELKLKFKRMYKQPYTDRMLILNKRQAHKLTQFTIQQLGNPWIRFYGPHFEPTLSRGYLSNIDLENYMRIKPVISELCRQNNSTCVGVYGDIGKTRQERRFIEQTTVRRIRLWKNRFPHLQFTHEYKNVGESTFCFFFCSVRR